MGQSPVALSSIGTFWNYETEFAGSSPGHEPIGITELKSGQPLHIVLGELLGNSLQEHLCGDVFLLP